MKSYGNLFLSQRSDMRISANYNNSLVIKERKIMDRAERVLALSNPTSLQGNHFEFS